MVHVARESEVINGYFWLVNLKESEALVDTSIDGRIISSDLNEVGCQWTDNISLFQCNAKWLAFMFESEQD
jgi:hypothetical protein